MQKPLALSLWVSLSAIFVGACGGEIEGTSAPAITTPAPPPPVGEEEGEKAAPLYPGSCDKMKSAPTGPAGGEIHFNLGMWDESYERVFAKETIGTRPDNGNFERTLYLVFEGGPTVGDDAKHGGVCVSQSYTHLPLLVRESATAPPEPALVGEYFEGDISGGDIRETCCENGTGFSVGGTFRIPNARIVITERTDTSLRGSIEMSHDGVTEQLASFRVPFVPAR